MGNIPYMDENVAKVDFVKSRLEALDQLMRQISDETNCIHHHSILTQGESQSSGSRIESLEQHISALQ
jgi:polyhydroxyalkanoate synthesis regulator phasin